MPDDRHITCLLSQDLLAWSELTGFSPEEVPSQEPMMLSACTHKKEASSCHFDDLSTNDLSKSYIPVELFPPSPPAVTHPDTVLCTLKVGCEREQSPLRHIEMDISTISSGWTPVRVLPFSPAEVRLWSHVGQWQHNNNNKKARIVLWFSWLEVSCMLVKSGRVGELKWIISRSREVWEWH